MGRGKSAVGSEDKLPGVGTTLGIQNRWCVPSWGAAARLTLSGGRFQSFVRVDLTLSIPLIRRFHVRTRIGSRAATDRSGRPLGTVPQSVRFVQWFFWSAGRARCDHRSVRRHIRSHRDHARRFRAGGLETSTPSSWQPALLFWNGVRRLGRARGRNTVDNNLPHVGGKPILTTEGRCACKVLA